ncbi:endoglucanase, partial [Pseudomonas syringae pv. actinidiae ICMP 19079]
MPALVINLRRAVGWMTGVLASATLTPVLAAST